MNFIIGFFIFIVCMLMPESGETLAIAPLLLGALIGTGAGLLKNIAVDRPRYNAQKTLAAETARYNPWTGLVPQVPTEPDAFSSSLQFGTTGALLGQGLGEKTISPTVGARPERNINLEGQVNPLNMRSRNLAFYKTNPFGRFNLSGLPTT